MTIQSKKIKSKILIIGGTGFIGSYVARDLIKKGNSVVVIHRSPLNPMQAIKGVVYKRDFELTPQLVKGIETVIFAPRPDPVVLIKALDFLGRFPKLNKIVYLSTFGLYPDSLKKQKETAPIVPASQYQRDKYYEEISFTQFAKRKDIKLCIARISNPYGDIQNKEMVNKIICQLLYQTDLTLNGDGNQLRDFIFIEDAAELISFLALRKQSSDHEVFNVCLGKGNSINEVVTILERLSGKKLIFKRQPLPDSEKKNSIGDNTKIILASRYQIRYSLAEGLKKTLDNYIKNI